jgi:hypothetical protein
MAFHRDSARQVPSVRHRRPWFERLEERRVLATTSIQVLAAGVTGTETLALEVDGVQVRSWQNVAGNAAGRQFVTLSYTHPTDVTADAIAVRFVSGTGSTADLRVDGIVVNGVNHESEATRTWSSGAWDNTLKAIAPLYGSGSNADETLYATGGAFYYSASAGSTVELFAAGATGTEQANLYVKGQLVGQYANIGGSYANGSYVRFVYNSPTKLRPEDVRVAFVNDGAAPSGADRNLRVDAIAIDGRRYQTEAAGTFSTGTWANGSVTPGFHQNERLQGNGSFVYSRLGEDGTSSAGTKLIVYAAGATGTETFNVIGDGAVFGGASNVAGDYGQRQFIAYAAVHPRALSFNQLQVAFTNDGLAPSGVDRNLRVDAVVLNGVRSETEDITTFSTGTWRAGLNVQPGFVQDERLHANGVFQYGQDTAAAGVLSIAQTQYSVAENAGFVDVQFVRTATRGAVTIDYTTVNGTAVAGQDFTATSGTAIFADGQASVTVRIPINNDSAQEGSEAFNVAADRVTGGAFLGAPRTTTVMILDDDAPNLGNGIGLLGEYFSGRNFETKVYERTDTTVDFNWGTGSPGGAMPTDNFSVRWTGQVQPLYSETYRFETTTDDGVRLWVNNQLVINRWVDQSATASAGTITLQAGVKYDIRLEFYENGGDAVAALRWSSPSQALQIVPTTQLYSVPVVPTTGQFTSQTVVSGLTEPTSMDFTTISGSSYMYVAQKDGRVRLAINGVLQSGVVVDYRTQVNNVRDRGLLGIAVHPNVAANPYLYILYTHDPPQTQGQSGLAAPDNYGNRGSRLTRLTLDASTGYRSVVAGSDVVLLGTNSTWDYIQAGQDSTDNMTLPPSGLLSNGEWVEDILITDSQSHTIGGLDWGPDGSLYVTNGDGTSYGRVDARTTRVQDLDSLSGKVLRINPITGDGYTDNPFYTGDIADDRSKVFNYGLRNPFRIAVSPVNGLPYVGDVGWNSWEEINGGRGENFGWPFYEGGAGNGTSGGDAINRQTGGYRDLPEAAAFYSANPNVEAPLWSRSHGAGGVAIVLGDFYTGSLYPSQYQNSLFFTDYGDPTIRAVTLNAQGALTNQMVVMGSVGTVIEMQMGPDGRMYYVDIAGGRVGRIDYVGVAPAALLAEAPIVARETFRPSLRGEPTVETTVEAESSTPVAYLLAPVVESTPSITAPVSTPASDAYDAALTLLLIEDAPTSGNEDEAAYFTTATDEEEAAEDAADLAIAFYSL